MKKCNYLLVLFVLSLYCCSSTGKQKSVGTKLLIEDQRQLAKKMVFCDCLYKELPVDSLGKKDASLSEYLQENAYKSPSTFVSLYKQSEIWRNSNTFFSLLQYEGYNVSVKKCLVLYESKYLDSLVRKYDYDIDLNLIPASGKN